MALLNDPATDPRGSQGTANNRKSGGGHQTNSNVVNIIRTIKERDLLPCIIFSFSRKDCEAYAAGIKGMDLNTGFSFISIQIT